MTNYPDAPDGRDTLDEGQKYQEFVKRVLNPWGIVHHHFQDKKQQYAFGENRQGHEIKLDERCFSYEPERRRKKPTNRLSIEVQEKGLRTNMEWIDSGILCRDNSWLYIQGNYEIIFVFAKNWLRRVYNETIAPEDIFEFNGTVRKFYLKLSHAMVGATLILRVMDRSKWIGEPLRKDEKGQWRL
jgi:hypothetical protein